MKLRHLLSIFFLFLVVILPESVPAFAQEAITLDKRNYIALSPQASSLHDAVNYPVDGNKGAADISIPLYTVEYGGIRIPIVLRYSTSSAKVDRSVAPNVGFGWVLDVGGSINRVIKGKPDEASVWYQADSETYFDQLGSNADQYTISSLYDWYGSVAYDTEKDEFVMSTPSGGGSFYLTESGGAYTGHFSPSVNWRIGATVKNTSGLPAFTGLEVYDGEGTCYRFGSGSPLTTPSSQDASYLEYCTYEPLGGTTYATGWQLREIEDDAGRKVRFTYTRSGNYVFSSWQDQWYRVQDSVSIFWTGGTVPDGQAAMEYVTRYTPEAANTERPYQLSAFRNLYPSTIEWPGGKVLFFVSNNLISGLSIHDASGALVRSYSFVTGTNDIHATSRLLSSVVVRGSDSTAVQTYAMDYYKTVTGTVTAVSCDWWGYFNGQTTMQNAFLPYRTIGAKGYDYSTSFYLGNGGHRAPDTTQIRHNILKSITYPGGGKTEFDFEANRYERERGSAVTPGTGPGLRIRGITYKDKDGTVLRRLGYSYTGGSIAAIPGDVRYETEPQYQLSVSEDQYGSGIVFVTLDRTRLISPKWGARIGGGGEAVDYTTVTERVYDGSAAVGKTVSIYEVPDNFQLGTTGFLNATECPLLGEEYHVQGESLSYNTSYLSYREEYDGADRLVRRTSYGYVEDETALLTNLGFCHLVYYNYPEAEAEPDAALLLRDYRAIRRMTRLNGPDGYPPLVYYLYTSSRGYRYPSGETVETFGVGSNGEVASTSFTTSRSIAYSTDKEWHYPVSVSSPRSDGTTERVSYTYPYTAAASYGAMRDSLLGRHRAGTVLSQTRWSGTTKIDSTVVLYGRYAGTDAPAGYFFRPASVKYGKGTSTPEVRISYASYDGWGNPRSIVYGKDDTENYIWSYSHQTPVAKVAGASWSEVTAALGSTALNALEDAAAPADATVTGALSSLRGIADALTEGRTHRPHYGVSGKYAPSGQKQTYAYDKLQRLTTALDHSAKVTTAVEYKDATGAGNSYVKLSTPDTALSAISSVAAARRRTVARYYDGQYREAQAVQAYGSGSGKDLVLPRSSYDAWGRVTDEWLPYEPSSGSGGSYRDSAASEQATYYTTHYSSTEAPYARRRTVYESSPVGRVLREYLPGSGAYADTSHATRHDYSANTAADAVYRWNITASTSVVTRGSAYAEGMLSKEVVTDPDGRTVTTFTDRGGRVVETRQGGLRTSYVYNDAGLLVAVIPPKAQPSGTSLTATMYYRYIYDARNRLTESYVPDKGKTEFVYDADDRLVASRDAQESADGKWRIYRYDRTGREVYTGLVTKSSSAATLRSSYANKAFHETRSSTGAVAGYTSSDTVIPMTESDVLTVTYYDSYGYPDAKAYVAAGTEVGQPSGTLPSPLVKGLVTGRKAKVLDGNELTASGTMLTTSLYYNALGRMTQEVGDIYTGGTAGTYRRSTQYRHQGEVAATKEEQTVGGTTTTVLRKYGYDNAGRQTKILQGVNGGTLALLETDTWDGTGRQATRVLGTGNQTLNYAWDIRDRLTGINDPASLGADKFAVSYTYETGAPAQYGGNISGATWKHAGGTAQTYAYSYDSYGRLTSGTHSGGNGETIEYDANGNISSLTRTGARAETLTYTYTSGTNRLGTLKSNGSSKTFQYNADGTMKTDGLRTLALTYNYLKLPRTVKRGTTSTVTYIYDANGNKLAVSQDGTAKNYYCGDFVYDGSLSVAYILTPNGQLTRNPTTGAYTTQYNIPDHLGNVRSVVSSSGTVLQSTDYYPFGLAFSDSDIASNRYLYNGKELEDYTLGTSYLGTLDYGARHYDPRIARWTVPDPMVESSYALTAYGYCGNKPVLLLDPDGQFPETVWDIANLMLDIQSLVENIRQGKVGASIVDGVGLVVDAAATAFPFVPGGAGTAIKGVRAADKAVEGIKTVDKVVDTEKEIEAINNGSKAAKRSLQESAEIGKEAHRQIEKEIVEQGGLVEVPYRIGDRMLRKDGLRKDGTYVIIKPNTPSGRKSALRRQKLMSNEKTEIIFYDPNNPIYRQGSPSYIGPKQKKKP